MSGAALDLRRLALLERESELQRVDDALELAAAGQGSLLVIEGHGGIGKTELGISSRRELAERLS